MMDFKCFGQAHFLLLLRSLEEQAATPPAVSDQSKKLCVQPVVIAMVASDLNHGPELELRHDESDHSCSLVTVDSSS